MMKRLKAQRRAVAEALQAAGHAEASGRHDGYRLSDDPGDPYLYVHAEAPLAHWQGREQGEARERELLRRFSAALKQAGIGHLADLGWSPVIRVVTVEPRAAVEARLAAIAAAISWVEDGDTWHGKLAGWCATIVEIPSYGSRSRFTIGLQRPDGIDITRPPDVGALSLAKLIVAERLLDHDELPFSEPVS